MNPEHQRSLLSIALFAAFADGAEREHSRALAESVMAMVQGARL